MPPEDEFLNSMSENPWRSRLGYMLNVSGGLRPRGSFYNDEERKERTRTAKQAWMEASTESYAVHLMKAVAAVIQGLEEYFIQKLGCTHVNQETCSQALNLKETDDKYESIKGVEIADLSANLKDGEPSRVFKDDGNGNVGYTVFWIDQKTTAAQELKREYVILADIPPDEGDFELNSPSFNDGENLISDDGKCYMTGGPISTPSPKTALTPVGSGLLAAIIVIVLMAVIFVAYKNRSYRCTCK